MPSRAPVRIKLICHVVGVCAALCLASNAAAIVISGGPVAAPPGGGSCSVSGSPNVGAGATVTCSGLNLTAVRHLYYGIRVDRGVNGDALDNTEPTALEIFRYSSSTPTSIRYTGQTQIFNSITNGFQVVSTEMRLGFPSSGGALISGDPVVHALNGANGDVEILWEVGSTSYAVTAKTNAFNGSTFVAAASYFDFINQPASHKNLDHVDMGFYYDTCGNSVREGTEQCDLGAANGTSTSCCDSDCRFRPSVFICRVGGGAPCDLSETCSGTGGTCPTDDAFANAGITCRIGSGDVCDPNEMCQGTPGVACPPDVVASTAVICRAGAGSPNGGSECDAQEMCSGVPGVPCPNNFFNTASTPCRAGSGDVCDPQEFCPGSSGGVCPTDVVSPTSTVCRAGSGDPTGSGVECDPTDHCTGIASEACPTNVPLTITTVCRSGSGDICDPDEKCPGTVGEPCPANTVANPSTVCRTGSNDSCDPNETCTGVANQSCPPDVVEPAGTVCRPPSEPTCDLEEQCTGSVGEPCPTDLFTAAAVPCDADGDTCTLDECDGSGLCVADSVISCDDGNACTRDTCDAELGCEHIDAPAQTCQAAITATFKLKGGDLTDETKDRFGFNWKGGPVLVSHLGNPTQTTQYDVCVYDGNGVKMHMTVPPGSGWFTLGSASEPKGYRYRDLDASADGITSIKSKTSSLNRATLRVSGKGANLPDPSIPLLYPVTAQLFASDGSCWGAEFGQPDTRRNDQTNFRAAFRNRPTPTSTPTRTRTSTPTFTLPPPTDTPGGPTRTPTVTPTETNTRTETPTSPPTPTQPSTPTATVTPTLTATPSIEPGTRVLMLPGGGSAGSCRGSCVGGSTPGASCSSNANCGGGGTCSSVKACAGGPYAGMSCSNFSDCNGCDPNQVCIASGTPLACCTGNNAGTCPVAGSCVLIQGSLTIRVPVNGVCVPRVAPDVPCLSDVECPSGKTCRLPELRLLTDTPDGNGEADLTIPQSSVVFNPASVGALGTVCLSAEGDGSGVVDCDGGLTGINIAARQDHNTTPGGSGNSGSASGLPDDPGCNDSFVQPDGSVSYACPEGMTTCSGGTNAGAVCSGPGDCPGGSCQACNSSSPHPGACNSPMQITLSGAFAAGDMLVTLPVGIALLDSSSLFGPDALPCTSDDTGGTSAANVLLSTGTATINVYDANNVAGSTRSPQVIGNRLTCAALNSGTITGLKIGGGFPGLDQLIGDAPTTFQFVAQ